MAQEIQELIAKIHQEGVQAAEDKARRIEAAAQRQAEELLMNAKRESEKLIADTRAALGRMEEKQRVLLAQAGRDLILSLRTRINDMLERITALEVRCALTAQTLAGIIGELIKGYNAQDIVITLKEEDRDALEKEFLSRLKETVKTGIELKSSDDIRAGFTISFDAGKSCYDFTDRAIAEYIGRHLKPQLNELLKESVSG